MERDRLAERDNLPSELVALLCDDVELLLESVDLLPQRVDGLHLGDGSYLYIFPPGKRFSLKAKKGNLPPLFLVTLSEKLIYISHMNRRVNDFCNYFAKIANFKYF